MSTKIMFRMTIDEAKEELEMNLRQQNAIEEKFGWIDLDDSDYIEAEHRLAECQKEETLLLSTIDFWEQFEKSLEKKEQKKDWSKELDEAVNFRAPDGKLLEQ